MNLYEFHYEIAYQYNNTNEPSSCKYKGNLDFIFFKKYPLLSHGDKCKNKNKK